MKSSALSPKPRLLVLASTYPRWQGDPEPGFVHELAKRLVDDFTVTVLCPHASGAAFDEEVDGVRIMRFRYAPARLETLVNDGGIVTNLRCAPWKWLLVPGFILSLSWRTWREVRALDASVIHAHWLLPQGLIAALLGSIGRRIPPFLVTSHGADLFALRGRALQVLKRFVVRRAAAVTVVSNAMREELAGIGLDVCNIEVRPMGVDLLERFTPDPTIMRSRKEVLFVGRFVEKKGLRYLIDAMPAILRQHPDAFLTVAGFGPEASEREAQVRLLGLDEKVHFIGAVEQSALPAIFRRAAVFVAPFVQASSGDREGLGLVSVEAAGCGCHVITSDLPAVHDVFPHHGMATLVPPADVSALEAAVVARLSGLDSTTTSSLSTRQILMKRFDWSVVASAYATKLRACIQDSRLR